MNIDPENHQFLLETNLPSPQNGRVKTENHPHWDEDRALIALETGHLTEKLVFQASFQVMVHGELS